MNTTHDTGLLWFGAGVVLALGVIFGLLLREPGLIGGGIGAAVGLGAGAICAGARNDDNRVWVRWLRQIFWTEW